MKRSFLRYVIPFFVAIIVFILTLMEAKMGNQEDWSPTMYGHFFPIFQDGPNSLSIQMDLWKFILDFALFYCLSLVVFNYFKPQIHAVVQIIISLIFVLVTTGFILIPSIDFSFTKINQSFDFTTLKSMWY